MSGAVANLVVGPAVVVDDKVDEAEGALLAILEQLDAAGLPVVTLAELPSVESLRHWRQLALIVLDWELSYAAADTEVPPGVTVPSTLEEETRSTVHDFIRACLRETSAPIFILSNASVDDIEADLSRNLTDIQDALGRRVQVYSKSAVQVDLMEKVYGWLESKPALLALKAWNRAYSLAEMATFHDFDDASGDWVGAILAAAEADGAPPVDELREILGRNVINRVGPLDLEFSSDQELPAPDGPGLRRVLSMGAVIPARGLDPTTIGTGDLFVLLDAGEPFDEIKVIVSPDCELVRGESLRLVFLTAVRQTEGLPNLSKKRVEKVKKGAEGQVWSCLLTPEGNEYAIRLSGWQMEWITPTDQDLWTGHRRIGRLMEPFLSHLQQNFALNISRKGLPRIPDIFFD